MTADRTLKRFDSLRSLTAREDVSEDVARQISEEAWALVEEAPPVKVSYAVSLLSLSDPTVRNWIAHGLLEAVGPAGRGPLRVTLDSLAEVKEVADELRARGQDGRLVSQVIAHIEGESLARDARFRRSVEQMNQGQRGTWPDDVAV